MSPLGEGVALRLGIVVLDLGRDGLRCAEIEGPEDRIHDVADPVADRAVAERHPAPPSARQVEGMVRPLLGRTEPEVPVEAGRNFLLLAQPRQHVDGGVDVGTAAMDRVDVADGAVPDPLAERADRVEGVALVAELGHDLVFLGGLHQGPDLADGVRQRLLAVDVLAPFDRGHRRHGVGMVRRADDHRVDLVAHLVEHLAVVLVHLGVGELRRRSARCGAASADRRRTGRPSACRCRELTSLISPAACPPAPMRGDVQLLARRRLPLPQHVARNDGERRHRARGRFEKTCVSMSRSICCP